MKNLIITLALALTLIGCTSNEQLYKFSYKNKCAVKTVGNGGTATFFAYSEFIDTNKVKEQIYQQYPELNDSCIVKKKIEPYEWSK